MIDPNVGGGGKIFDPKVGGGGSMLLPFCACEELFCSPDDIIAMTTALD